MLDAEEAIKAYRDFEHRSHAWMSDQIDNIKEDRDFLRGEQWTADDDKLVDPSRVRRTVNIISNSCNAVSNSYGGYPYKWYTGDDTIDQVLDSFLDTGSNSRAPQLALYSSTAYGLGCMVLGTEQLQGVEVPALYSMQDIAQVRLDPDSVEIDGSDAMEGAIIELRSKTYIKSKYGEEWITGRNRKPRVDTSAPHGDDTMAIVTYYKLEDGACTVYKLLNDDFLQPPVQLPISRVPLFPVYGEPVWCDDDKTIYQGLVRKARPVQTIINYCYTQLAERLAQAPKQTWLATVEAVEDLNDGYRNYARNTNPLLLYNRTTADGKTVLEPPQRLDNRVQYDDINAIIASNLELMQSITGVDARGIIDTGSSLTATEVLFNERSAQTNIRHFFENLRSTMKSVGDCILEMLGVEGMTVNVIQGPEENMQRQVARQELIQLAGLVEPAQKQALVDGVLMSHNDNAILRNVYGAMHQGQGPTMMEQQAFETIEQMKAAIAERDQKLQEMQQTIDAYEKSSQDQERGLQAQFAMEGLKHQQKMEEMTLQAQLDQGADAGTAQADAVKAQMDLQKTAIQLDTAKVKAAADRAKAISTIYGGV